MKQKYKNWVAVAGWTVMLVVTVFQSDIRAFLVGGSVPVVDHIWPWVRVVLVVVVAGVPAYVVSRLWTDVRDLMSRPAGDPSRLDKIVGSLDTVALRVKESSETLSGEFRMLDKRVSNLEDAIRLRPDAPS